MIKPHALTLPSVVGLCLNLATCVVCACHFEPSALTRPPLRRVHAPLALLAPPHPPRSGLRAYARQCLISRGLLPLLAAPSPSGEALLEEAIRSAARLGLVHALDHVVVVQRVHEDFCVKIVSVSETGRVSGPHLQCVTALVLAEAPHCLVPPVCCRLPGEPPAALTLHDFEAHGDPPQPQGILRDDDDEEALRLSRCGSHKYVSSLLRNTMLR